MGQGFLQLRPIVTLAALDLDVFAEQMPVATVQVIVHCLALGFESEPATALPLRADP